MSCRKLKIARLFSLTACMIGIIRVIGACSVADQKLFYLYVDSLKEAGRKTVVLEDKK